MRAPWTLAFVVLMPLLLAGCTGDQATPGPDEATAMALVPSEDEIGRPAAWGRPLGQGRHEIQGEADLFMVFGVETTDPNSSRLVHGLYNMRDHVQEDPAPGNGAAPHWLYQHRDASAIRMQRVQAADGDESGSAWGAEWDWSYWIVASPERPIPMDAWRIDSDAAAQAAAGTLADWGNPERDHAYLLYVPEGHTEPYWLLILWGPDGATRDHLLLRADDGTAVPLDEVHPETADREHLEGTLVPGVQDASGHVLEPGQNRSRLVVRVTPTVPAPAGSVEVTVSAEGWEETSREMHTNGTWAIILESLGGGPVDVRVATSGGPTSYALDWCADGRFNDIFARTPTLCDPWT